MLEANDLQHTYGNRQVLNIEHFELPIASVTALTGANGSGKSTLLRILSFLEKPTNGQISLNGQLIQTRQEKSKARKSVTMVEQQPLLFGGTVVQNLKYALGLRGIHGRDAREQISVAFERLGIADLSEQRARSLSDGQIQRVAIARAVVLRPKVLLLDEPVSAADRAASAQLFKVLAEEADKGTAICFASHQLEHAFRWSKRIISLTDGRTGTLTPENLFRATLPEGTGLRTIGIGTVELQIVTDKSGPVTLVLPPDEIMLSRHKLESSARNQFEGQVRQLSDDGHGRVTLNVDVGVDLAVRVTHQALEDLDISLGSKVVLSIKAMAVRVV